MKALWALSPFHQDKKLVQSMHSLLEQIVGKRSDIEIGFIADRCENELNLAFDIPYEDRFDAYPRKLLKESLGKAKIKIEDKQIHVVNGEFFTTTKSVDCFLSLAKARNSNLVALYTHAHKGYTRFIMGSFAETALRRSKLNLLLVNPKTSFSPKLRNILFASDYGPAAKKQIKPVLELSKKLNAQLIVFHHANPILSASPKESTPTIHENSKKLSQMEVWIKRECARAGVSCKVIVDSTSRGTADLILKNGSKFKTDLFVVSAKAGPLLALMGGSVTRQVVRAASKPVLVLKENQ